MLDQDNQNNLLYGQLNLTQAIGYLLILSGLGAMCGVLLEIYAIFIDPQELVVFQQLFPEYLTVAWKGEFITVSSQVLAYSVPVLLLSIAGGMASTLINAGIKLMPSKRR